MNDRDLTPAEIAVLVLDEAENLIWALLDDHLDEANAARLAKLLEDHESVRQRYIDCVQLHVDLQDHFTANRETSIAATGTPILPNLTPSLPGGDSAIAK
jgi:hypothetical protein